MFHSLGTVQSKTFVPVGTSESVSGTSSFKMRSDSRKPSPDRLRQIGHNRSKYFSKISFIQPLCLKFCVQTQKLECTNLYPSLSIQPVPTFVLFTYNFFVCMVENWNLIPKQIMQGFGNKDRRMLLDLASTKTRLYRRFVLLCF